MSFLALLRDVVGGLLMLAIVALASDKRWRPLNPLHAALIDEAAARSWGWRYFPRIMDRAMWLRFQLRRAIKSLTAPARR